MSLGAVGGLLWGTQGRPIAYAQDRYWQNRDNWLREAEYTATVVPPEAAGAVSGLERLSDKNENAWTLFWTAQTPPAVCGALGASPELLLSFEEPQSVQRIRIAPGLWDTAVRPVQFRPTEIVVSSEDQCLGTYALPDAPELTTLILAGGPRVQTLRIGFSQVAPPVEGGEEALSLTEVQLLARPF